MMYHPDPSVFIQESKEFAALGRTQVALSNLEYAHDKFIFEMLEQNKNLALSFSPKFPRHFAKKTDFLISSILAMPKLRREPIFQDGELNLVWLQYQLDELYQIRSIIAHGSVFLTENSNNRVTWTFDRYVNKGKQKWAEESVKISNGYLASVHLTASTLKHFLYRLIRCLDGVSNWERDYQTDKEIRQNEKFFEELIQLGVLDESKSWLKNFPKKRPVE